MQHLLHHHGVAGVAKLAREALAHALQGLLGGLGNYDALAGGQAVGLHHAGATNLAHVGGAGGLVREALVGGRGHAGLGHDLLGELLGALHAGGVGVGAEGGNARGAHGVANALNQRGLRTNDN